MVRTKVRRDAYESDTLTALQRPLAVLSTAANF